MSLKEPIVDGAYTEERAKALGDVVDCLVFALNKGVPKDRLAKLTCSVLDVYLIPTDPAEVVAELRRMRHSAMTDVANWLAQKLGVK